MTRIDESAEYMTGEDTGLSSVIADLMSASHEIYINVKEEIGLSNADTQNQSGDTQILLDVLADKFFRDRLSRNSNIAYVVSEEQSNLTQYANGKYSVALDLAPST